jgi:TolB-like protein/DNA-binding winged helix-turn-helix (wHTH) protein/Tfp pilus assembly protein PilF
MELAREPNFRLGGMDVRPSTREIVFATGREVLEPRVMAVLVVLARAKGEVVTRDDLTAACWEGRVVSDDAINRVISRIRRASDLTGGKDFTLDTITKVGYRLVAAERPAVAQTGAAPAQAAVRKRPPAGVIAALAAAAVLVATGAWWLAGREPEWSPDPNRSLTLAVLPFDNLGSAREDAPLAVGMAREIRNTLSRVRGLRVVSDTSSFALASEPLGDTEIGRRLQADLLVDGSFARTGDTVKLSVELVDPWKGVNLWTGSRSGPAANLDELRQQMSAAVFEQLAVRLGPNRVEKLAEPKPGDPQVYRLVMEAEQLLESTTSARMRGRPDQALDAGDKADALIEQALKIDAESALALRLKAQIIAMGATHALFASNTPTPEKQAQAAVYLRKALAADPDAAPALGALGEYYRRFEWRWGEAKALMERALALDPNSSEGHLSYSYYLSGAGRCREALYHAQTAIALDPEFGWGTLGVPRALKCLGRYAESDDAYRKALAHERDNLFMLREAYLNFLIRRDVDGLEKLRTYVRDDLWKGAADGDVKLWLDWTAAAVKGLKGDKAAFLAIIDEDMRLNGITDAAQTVSVGRGKGDIMWILAVELAIAGDSKRAVDMLENAISLGSLYIPETMPYGAFEFTPEVRASPHYQAIWRNDPRLAELVKMRLASVEAKQMAGVRPDGTRVLPSEAVDTRS